MNSGKPVFFLILFSVPIILALYLHHRAPNVLDEQTKKVIAYQKPTVSEWAAANFDPIGDNPGFFQKLETIELKNADGLTTIQNQQLKETIRNYVMAYHLGTFEAYARFRIPVADFTLAPSLLAYETEQLKNENQTPPSESVKMLALYWQREVKDEWKHFWTGISFASASVDIQVATNAIPSLKNYVFGRKNLGVASSGPIAQFKVTPDSILHKDSRVYYATASLLIKNEDVTCPVYCRFYWAGEYSKWLPFEQDTAYAGPRKKTLLF
jgi:hypothetical protein